MTLDAESLPEAVRSAWTAPITYSDPGSFPPIDVRAFSRLGTGQGIVRETPFTSRRFLRYGPEFVDDPDDCGLFKNLGASVYVSAPAFVAAADNVALVGYRTLIADGHFFNDEIYSPEQLEKQLSRLSQPDSFLNEDTRLRQQADSDIFVLEQSGQPWRRYEGAVVILCSQEPSNYGSFLFRVLPKVHALKRLGLTDLPVVCWNIKPATTALLEVAGLDPNRIIFHNTQAVTIFDRAIVPSLRNPSALLDYESRELYRQIRNEYGSLPGRKRLYISRFGHGQRVGRGRIMLNEEELIGRLAAIGFDIVEPERLSTREQIALFSSAEMVVGPSGAGMFNIVFCQPGTKVMDIESEPHWIYAHAGLFASCELRYGIFVGQVDATDDQPVHRRWNVNIGALMDRIESFLRT
jgi:capsular polysaccharide biosynthesis protein